MQFILNGALLKCARLGGSGSMSAPQPLQPAIPSRYPLRRMLQLLTGLMPERLQTVECGMAEAAVAPVGVVALPAAVTTLVLIVSDLLETVGHVRIVAVAGAATARPGLRRDCHMVTSRAIRMQWMNPVEIGVKGNRAVQVRVWRACTGFVAEFIVPAVLV